VNNAIKLLLIVFFIFCIGLVMIFGASSGEILDLASSRSLYAASIKQVLFSLIGVFAAIITYVLGWRRFVEYGRPLLYFGIFLLFLVFIPGIGVTANGARRWISFGGLTLQPSELIKYLVPLYLVAVFHNNRNMGSRNEFFKAIVPVTFAILLILLQPDNGTAGVIVVTAGIMILFLRVPVRFWLPLALIALVTITLFAWNSKYVRARLASYMSGKDIKGKGHQPYQAKIAAGSGGMFGVGIGKSRQKLSYLPEAQNDYIAAIYAEECGFLGMLLLILLYILLTYYGLKISLLTEEQPAILLGSSVVFLFSFQAFMNLGVVSGLLPSTGLNLPFFSQGGSSLMANMSALGLLLSCGATNWTLDGRGVKLWKKEL
jgi:cell division protein FtsW